MITGCRLGDRPWTIDPQLSPIISSPSAWIGVHRRFQLRALSAPPLRPLRLCGEFPIPEEEAAMEYRRMGRCGLKVSEVCLGTMTFGHGAEEAEAQRIVDLAREAG